MKKYTTYALLGALFVVVACSFAGSVSAQPNGSKEAPAGPSPVESAAPVAPPSYRLIGTVGGNAFAGAVFDDSTGVQTFSRLYEKLPDGSQIVNIYDDRIALKRPDGTVFEMYTIHDAKAGASAKSPVSASQTGPAAAVAEARRPVERQTNVVRPSAGVQRAGKDRNKKGIEEGNGDARGTDPRRTSRTRSLEQQP